MASELVPKVLLFKSTSTFQIQTVGPHDNHLSCLILFCIFFFLVHVHRKAVANLFEAVGETDLHAVVDV